MSLQMSLINLTSSIVTQSGNGTIIYRPSILISDADYSIIRQCVQLLFAPIEVFGVTANIVNLFVFWSIGLKDNVTSSFFGLSLSDLCYLLVSLYMWICFRLDSFLGQQEVHFGQLGFLGFFYRSMPWVASILITTYIAVQRCCCVAMPLKFKMVFTTKLNAAVIIVICAASATIYLPIVANQSYGAMDSPWWSSKLRKDILKVTDLLAGTIIPIVSQVVTIICMFILTSSLRKSSKFRQGAVSQSRDQSSYNKNGKTNNKEIQIVKAVTMVSLMFIICNVPTISIALTRRLVPEFDLFKRHENVFHVCNIIKDKMQGLNASLNIVVYYVFNSTYRGILKHRILSKLCYCCKPKDKKSVN